MAPGGYAWWYVDALSDDGRHGLTVIAFIGSVFSPYYAWARRGGRLVDASRHCALNVALYGSARRWSMTERGRAALEAGPDQLRIGPSRVCCEADGLSIHIDEVTAPWPSRLRGIVRVQPAPWHGSMFSLDAAGRHRWYPLAPCARVEAQFDSPALRWSGSGYVDGNRGDAPLEEDFARWDWARARLSMRRSAVVYDVTRRDGTSRNLALQFDDSGAMQPFDAPPPATLPATKWRIERGTRSEAGTTAKVRRTLEDGPFYARSLVEARWLGVPVAALHESLSLDRFRRPWVRALLPLRMPRSRC